MRDAAGGAAGGEGARRSKRWRWVVGLAVAAAVGLAVLVAVLPALLSTGPGRAAVLERVSGMIPGSVSAEALGLSWWGGLRASGVELRDPAGGPVGTVAAVELPDAGLWTLLRGGRDLGAVAVRGVRLDLVRDAEGRTNLDRALGTSLLSEASGSGDGDTSGPGDGKESRGNGGGDDGDGPTIPPGLSLEFALRDALVTMTGPGMEAATVTVPEAGLTVLGPTRLGLTLDATVRQGGDEGRVKLAGTVDRLFDEAGRWSVADAAFDVAGTVERLPLAAVDRLRGTGGVLEAMLGPRLEASVKLTGSLAEVQGLVTAESERLSLRQAVTADGRRVTAGAASHGELLVTPGAWAAALGGSAPVLVEPFRLVFAVDELEAPRAGNNSGIGGAAGGTLDLGQTRYGVSLRVAGGDRLRVDVPGRGVVESTLAVQAGSTAADRSATLRVEADVRLGDAAGPLRAVVEATRGDAGWDAGTVDALLAALPMPVVDALAGQGHRLTATLGETLGLGVLAAADGAGGYALTVNFDPPSADSATDAAPRLRGQLTGTYDAGGAVVLHTDERLALTLSPEAFELWQQPATAAAGTPTPDGTAGLSLIEPMPLALELDLKAALRRGPGLRFDPNRTGVTLDVRLPRATVRDRWYDRDFSLVNGRVTLNAPDPREPATVAVLFETDRAPSDATVDPSTPGRLAADATVTGLMLDDGYLQTEHATVNGRVTLTNLPTAVFDALTRQRGYAVAAFGRELSATLATDAFSLAAGGNVDFELDSANGTVGSLPATVHPDRTLTLRAPATFYLNATPELSSRILRLVNPIVLPAVVSASVPIVITLDDDSFTVPLDRFTWQAVNADARVMMNRVNIAPDVAPVDRIIPKLVRFNLLREQPQYLARIAPIVLSIRGGVLAYERLPIALDDVDLDFGGRIDLNDRAVNMTLTVAGEAFTKDDFLKTLGHIDVAIGGTIDHPTVQMETLEKLLQNTVRDVGRDLLQQGADRLFKDLFRKKDGE